MQDKELSELSELSELITEVLRGESERRGEREREEASLALRAKRPHTVGFIGVCDQEKGWSNIQGAVSVHLRVSRARRGALRAVRVVRVYNEGVEFVMSDT